MQEGPKPTILEIGDEVLIETRLEEDLFAVRGRLSSLLPQTLWVNTVDFGGHPLLEQVPEGNQIRFSAYKSHNALVGDSTFLRLLGPKHALVAIERPAELQLVDRRASIRVPIRRPVALRVANESVAGDGGVPGLAWSVNVSLSGILVETTLRVDLGDPVVLSIQLGTGTEKTVNAMAQVVRLQDPPAHRLLQDLPTVVPPDDGRRRIYAGLQFATVSSGDRDRLQAFLGKAAAASCGPVDSGQTPPGGRRLS
jgi:hypothetical protein